MKAALAQAQQKSQVAEALAQAQQTVSGGGGGIGRGSGGGGLYDVYAGQVILAVRPNWSAAIYSRDLLVVMVRVVLDKSGQVLDATVERSSGRADFDASAVNAVLRTRSLPPPPTAEQQEIVIAFNSLEMAN